MRSAASAFTSPNGPNVSTGAGCGTCGNATRAEPLLRPRCASRWRNHGARQLGGTPTHVNLRKIYVRAAIVRPLINRRHLLSAGVCALLGFTPRRADAAAMSRVTAYAFTFKGLDGGDIPLSTYAGHPMLVVNTASLCGYTPQYAGLQALWTRYRDKGLIVLGVPSNDFGGQEPGGAKDIHATAQGEYHVTFPITEKVTVKGKDPHPFYKWAAAERPLEATVDASWLSAYLRRPQRVFLRDALGAAEGRRTPVALG
jgi:glutathione peroxidase